MIRVTVLYPKKQGTTFNYDYYVKTHMQMVKDQLSSFGLVGVTTDKAVGTMDPNVPAPYHAISTMTFETLQGFQESFAKKGEALMGDLPNFTNTSLEVVISEVLI